MAGSIQHWMGGRFDPASQSFVTEDHFGLNGQTMEDYFNKILNGYLIKKNALDSSLRVDGAPVDSLVVGSTFGDLYNNIAGVYDSTKTYKAKDICLAPSNISYIPPRPFVYDIYMCVTDIDEPEEFDSSHWTSLTFNQGFKNIQQLKDIIMGIITNTGITPDVFSEIIKNGKAREYFNIGDIICIPWTDKSGEEEVEYQYPFVIVDFVEGENELGEKFEDSVVLQALYSIPFSLVFDAGERIEVPIGSVVEEGYYYYRYVNNAYSLVEDLPVGSITTEILYKHDFQPASSVITYGLNDYHWSAYRQWLNSNVDKNVGWWAPQHDCDNTVGTTDNNLPGFMNGFNDDWKSIFTRSKLITRRNQTFFDRELISDYDYFFLPAARQIGINGPIDEGDVWKYWKDILGDEYPVSVSDTPHDYYKVPKVSDTNIVTTNLCRTCNVTNTTRMENLTTAGAANANRHSYNRSFCFPATVILGKKKLNPPKYYGIVDNVPVASFSNAAEEPLAALSSKIIPVQDLHGYDAPWAPGAGVNLANFDGIGAYALSSYGLTTTIDKNNEEVTISGTYTDTSSTPQFITLFAPGVSKDLSLKAFEQTEGNHIVSIYWNPSESFHYIYIQLANMVKNTTYTIKFKLVAYTGSTEPTSWTPYSNICPISGFTEANMTRAGKNLINIPDQTNVTTSSISTTYNQILHKLRFKANTVYTFSCDFSSSDTTRYWGIRVRYTSGTIDYLWIHDKTSNKHSVTTRANASIALISFSYDTSFTISASNIQFEEGSTATSYSPYEGDIYTVSFGEAGTVYGGMLDVTTGTLTVDKAIVDLGTRDWSYSTGIGYAGFTAKITSDSSVYYAKKEWFGLCSSYPYVGKYNVVQDMQCGYIFSNYVYIKDSRYGTDTATFKTAMSGVQLVYEIATPITYQLTPTEITTLLGQNTIWADVGNTSLTYVVNQN